MSLPIRSLLLTAASASSRCVGAARSLSRMSAVVTRRSAVGRTIMSRYMDGPVVADKRVPRRAATVFDEEAPPSGDALAPQSESEITAPLQSSGSLTEDLRGAASLTNVLQGDGDGGGVNRRLGAPDALVLPPRHRAGQERETGVSLYHVQSWRVGEKSERRCSVWSSTAGTTKSTKRTSTSRCPSSGDGRVAGSALCVYACQLPDVPTRHIIGCAPRQRAYSYWKGQGSWL